MLLDGGTKELQCLAALYEMNAKVNAMSKEMIYADWWEFQATTNPLWDLKKDPKKLAEKLVEFWRTA